ncbi:MAG: 4'-phosphopantetheinyl transferase superfamily protein [Bacteroidota bacterium]
MKSKPRSYLLQQPFYIPTTKAPQLLPTSVHLWLVNVRAPDSVALSTLAEKEIQRADKFRFPIDRHRFLRARSILRLLLGDYLQTNPANIDLAFGKEGKPYLSHFPEWHFNLSHSGNWIVLAFRKMLPVGVDVEHIDPAAPFDELTTACFTNTEVSAWRELPGDLQPTAFFRSWTTKEAIMKADGRGVSLHPKNIQLTVDPTTSPNIEILEGKLGPKNWWTRAFMVADNYAAALAGKGKVENIEFLHWLDG